MGLFELSCKKNHIQSTIKKSFETMPVSDTSTHYTTIISAKVKSISESSKGYDRLNHHFRDFLSPLVGHLPILRLLRKNDNPTIQSKPRT